MPRRRKSGFGALTPMKRNLIIVGVIIVILALGLGLGFGLGGGEIKAAVSKTVTNMVVDKAEKKVDKAQEALDVVNDVSAEDLPGAADEISKVNTLAIQARAAASAAVETAIENKRISQERRAEASQRQMDMQADALREAAMVAKETEANAALEKAQNERLEAERIKEEAAKLAQAAETAKRAEEARKRAEEAKDKAQKVAAQREAARLEEEAAAQKKKADEEAEHQRLVDRSSAFSKASRNIQTWQKLLERSANLYSEYVLTTSKSVKPLFDGLQQLYLRAKKISINPKEDSNFSVAQANAQAASIKTKIDQLIAGTLPGIQNALKAGHAAPVAPLTIAGNNAFHAFGGAVWFYPAPNFNGTLYLQWLGGNFKQRKITSGKYEGHKGGDFKKQTQFNLGQRAFALGGSLIVGKGVQVMLISNWWKKALTAGSSVQMIGTRELGEASKFARIFKSGQAIPDLEATGLQGIVEYIILAPDPLLGVLLYQHDRLGGNVQYIPAGPGGVWQGNVGGGVSSLWIGENVKLAGSNEKWDKPVDKHNHLLSLDGGSTGLAATYLHDMNDKLKSIAICNGSGCTCNNKLMGGRFCQIRGGCNQPDPPHGCGKCGCGVGVTVGQKQPSRGWATFKQVLSLTGKGAFALATAGI